MSIQYSTTQRTIQREMEPVTLQSNQTTINEIDIITYINLSHSNEVIKISSRYVKSTRTKDIKNGLGSFSKYEITIYVVKDCIPKLFEPELC